MAVASSTTHDPLVERTTDLLRQVSRLMRAGSQEDWVSLSLTRAQLRVLMLLHQDGPAAVGQVANHLGVTLPSVTATVDRLVSQGLVSRQDDPNDRRRVINHLTSAGSTLIERLQEGKRARLVAALERVNGEDLRELARTLTVLERALLELPKQEE